jgi:hypothetical protein
MRVVVDLAIRQGYAPCAISGAGGVPADAQAAIVPTMTCHHGDAAWPDPSARVQLPGAQ